MARRALCLGGRVQAVGARRSGRTGGVDRQLANRNLRTALIAGAISLIVFALSFFVGLIY